MKALIFAVALTGFASAAMAGEPAKTTPTKAPVKLTEAQMDTVTAGALITVVDVVDVRNNEIIKNVQVNVPVAASVAVLGQAASGVINNPTGRVR